MMPDILLHQLFQFFLHLSTYRKGIKLLDTAADYILHRINCGWMQSFPILDLVAALAAQHPLPRLTEHFQFLRRATGHTCKHFRRLPIDTDRLQFKYVTDQFIRYGLSYKRTQRLVQKFQHFPLIIILFCIIVRKFHEIKPIVGSLHIHAQL